MLTEKVQDTDTEETSTTVQLRDAMVNHTASICVDAGNTPLVYIPSAGMSADMFLSSLPESERQGWNCRQCLQIIERYSPVFAVYKLLDEGPLEFSSYMWPDPSAVPEMFKQAAMLAKENSELLANSKKIAITPTPKYRRKIQTSGGVYLGNYESGGYNHIQIRIPDVLGEDIVPPETFYRLFVAPGKERVLRLAAITRATMEAADISVVGRRQSDLLEKIVTAIWSHEEHLRVRIAIMAKCDYIARCARSVTATFYEELLVGGDDNIAHNVAAFKRRTATMAYKTPDVNAVTENQHKAAYDYLAKNGYDMSLSRRMAVLSDFDLIWKPKQEDGNKSPIDLLYGQSKKSSPVVIPGITDISKEDFIKTVICDKTTDIKIGTRTSVGVIVTFPLNKDAKPIIKSKDQSQFLVRGDISQGKPVSIAMLYDACGPRIDCIGITRNEDGDHLLLYTGTVNRGGLGVVLKATLIDELYPYGNSIQAITSDVPGDTNVAIGAIPVHSGAVFTVTSDNMVREYRVI